MRRTGNIQFQNYRFLTGFVSLPWLWVTYTVRISYIETWSPKIYCLLSRMKSRLVTSEFQRCSRILSTWQRLLQEPHTTFLLRYALAKVTTTKAICGCWVASCMRCVCSDVLLKVIAWTWSLTRLPKCNKKSYLMLMNPSSISLLTFSCRRQLPYEHRSKRFSVFLKLRIISRKWRIKLVIT